MSVPTAEQIKAASKDVAWEYAMLLGSALEMAEAHREPINHTIGESFLVHVRNLAEFFRSGVDEFRKNPSVPPPRPKDNIYGVDFCQSVQWDETPFAAGTKLSRSINKTLSHMTYSRDLVLGHSEINIVFDGYRHVHGTVKLVSRTWGLFINSLRPDYVAPATSQDIQYWLAFHTRNWRVPFAELHQRFESKARGWTHWQFDQTPDGPV